MVYIEEAHASDVWQVGANERDQVIVVSPASFEQRNSVARSCVRNLGIKFPAVIDDFENSTERAYTAWPDRLYVVDREGLVAYKSDAGPYGFRTSYVEEALKRLLGQS